MKGGKAGEEERRRETTGGWILPSALTFASPRVPPSRLPLFSLMSVLSGGSQCESVAIIYTHAVTLYYTHVAISSLILCAVCLYHGSVREKAAGALERHRNCWYSLCGDREEFYLR